MKRNSSIRIFAILNVLGYAGTLAVNGLANTLPINGMTTGEISDQYPNLFVPAGFTFSIWGLIYLLLAIFVTFQLIRSFRSGAEENGFIRKIGSLFIITSIANMGWILAWHYEFVFLSVVIMLLLLGCLIIIYLRLGIGTASVRISEKYLVHIPFSIYLGWITVATIANITALLVAVGWNKSGLSETSWAAIMIVVAGIIGSLMLTRKKDIFFNLVIIWALIGIIAKRAVAEGEQSMLLIIVSALVIAVLLIQITGLIMRKKTN